ncbi:MAG: RNA methyltransferase [Vicinamibacterales bacterium]
MQRITSRQNPIVAEYRAAARGDVAETLLLDGTHLLAEAIEAGIRLRHVLVASDAVEHSDVAAVLAHVASDTPTAIASAQVMDAVSPVRSSSPVVALGVRPIASQTQTAAAAPIVVLCDVQDPGNVGAILRVAEAAGAASIGVAGQTADPYGWKALRGSMGSALRLSIQQWPDAREAIAAVRHQGFRVVATVPRDGQPLFESPLAGAVALFIGGEGGGLDADIVDQADVKVTIPMEPPVESLNASVAAAIVLYEARRQRTLASSGVPVSATVD